MKKRFLDDGRTVYHFMHLFLVECPRCGHCARVLGGDEPDITPSKVRVSCLHCAYTKRWLNSSYGGYSATYDWYFGLPLWLQTPCCGDALIAYNAEHLDYIEAFVTADLRDVARANWTLASRLPKWMQLRHNRDDVLAGIERLRQRLRET